MNELQKVFKYGESPVRTVVKGDEVWFVAKDVCDVLGIKNHSDSVSRLNEKQKSVLGVSDPHGRLQNTSVISEPGVYKLAFRSNKPEAEKFSDWVAEDVLPSIRKHGAYMTDDVLERTINDPDYMIGLLTKLKEEKQKRQALEVKTLMLEQQVAEAEPKVTYYDEILKSTNVVTITQIAKDYGMSGQALNELLHEEGVQYKQSGQWLLYHKYQAKGYTKSETQPYKKRNGETGTRLHTKWTQKGRLFIHSVLASKGIEPLMDREEIMQA